MVEFIIKIIIPLLCSVLVIYIIPLLKEKHLYFYVVTAVRAAEQMYKHGMNEEKFEHVKTWIQTKFKISDDDLKNIIESAVYELKNK